MDYVFVASKKSSGKVFHLPDCKYVVEKSKDELVGFYTYMDGFQNEHRACKCCLPVLTQYMKEQREFARLTFCYHMTYKYVADYIEVVTAYSRWRILWDTKDGLVLYHRNEFERRGVKYEIPGYHRQKVLCDTLVGYFWYIRKHDIYRLSHPIESKRPLSVPVKSGENFAPKQKESKILKNSYGKKYDLKPKPVSHSSSKAARKKAQKKEREAARKRTLELLGIVDYTTLKAKVG